MDIDKISSLFILFSGETDIQKYMSVINASMYDVLPRLKKTADLSDERLAFLCAAIANLRYIQIISQNDKNIYTYAGTLTVNDYGAKKSELARNLVRDYWMSIPDLLDDSEFIFIKV